MGIRWGADVYGVSYMRKNHQHIGMQNVGEIGKLAPKDKTQPNAGANTNVPSEDNNNTAINGLANQPFRPLVGSKEQPEFSLSRARTATERLFPEIPATDTRHDHSPLGRQPPENQHIEQSELEEGLERELATNIHPEMASLYLPDLDDEQELKKNTINVQNRCDNLIHAEQNTPEAHQNSNAGTGIFGNGPAKSATRNNSKGRQFPRSGIVAAIALLLIMGGGVFGYVNQQNPEGLAPFEKVASTNTNIAEIVAQATQYQQPLIRTTSPVISGNLTANRAVENSQPRPNVRERVQAIENLVGSAQRNSNTIGVNVQRTLPADADNVAVGFVEEEPARTIVKQITILPERFAKNVQPNTTRSAIRTQQKTTISQPARAAKSSSVTLSNTPISAPVIVASRSPDRVVKPENTLRKTSQGLGQSRDAALIERVVLEANAGNTLNPDQFKILVGMLVQGDCLSSAITAIFGDRKISPIFVRDVYINMGKKC